MSSLKTVVGEEMTCFRSGCLKAAAKILEYSGNYEFADVVDAAVVVFVLVVVFVAAAVVVVFVVLDVVVAAVVVVVVLAVVVVVEVVPFFVQ